jgi:hypothetical protein
MKLRQNGTVFRLVTGRFGSRPEQRTADYRILNIEGWKRFAKSFLKQIR